MRKHRIITCAAAGTLLLYIGSYAAFSITGGWVISESGKHRLIAGLAASDVLVWQPRYGFCEQFMQIDGTTILRADRLGYLYSPLILLDQKAFHPTIQYIGEDGAILDSFPPYESYHPFRTNRFHGRFPYEEKPQPAAIGEQAEAR